MALSARRIENGGLVLFVALATLFLGAIVGWADSRDAGPWQDNQTRNTAIGWGIVGGAIVMGTIAAVFV